MEKAVYSIGGLTVNVYSNKQDDQGAVTALFFLHGRYGSAEQVEPIIFSLDKNLKEKGVRKSYIIVTFVSSYSDIDVQAQYANWIGTTSG
jgi:hypothetical protein